MRIAIGSDHAGYALKSLLADHLAAAGHEVLDLGTDSAEVSVDYPRYGHAVAEAVDAVDAFFATEFEGGRHQRRIDQIAAYDAGSAGAAATPV